MASVLQECQRLWLARSGAPWKAAGGRYHPVLLEAERRQVESSMEANEGGARQGFTMFQQRGAPAGV